MKRYRTCAFLCLILTVVPGVALGAPIGVRGGFTLDPDQFHVGFHALAGEPFSGVSFIPNLEIGLGDDMTIIAFNGELVYIFPERATSNWQFYAGGGLGVNVFDWDHGPRHDDTETDLGLNGLGGMIRKLSSGNDFFLELKLGLVDSPDVKITAGFTFF